MAMKNETRREKENQFVVCGEIIDIVNFDEKNIGEANEWWKYTLRIETNPETQETIDVEFFTTVSNETKNKSMTTVYETVKTRAKDGKGTIVRCTGSLSSNDHYSKGEFVKKAVLNGSFCNRQGEKGSDKYDFTPCATFKALGLVNEVIEEEGKLILDCLVNEYKTKNGKIKGGYIDFVVTGEKDIKGLSGQIKRTKEQVDEKFILMPLSGKILKEIEIIEADESQLIEENSEDAWGDFEEEIEKRNEYKRDLKENGIRKEKLLLKLVGAKKGLSKEQVEENGYPFGEYDIKDMVDAYEHTLEDSRLRDEEKMSKTISDSEVPF